MTERKEDFSFSDIVGIPPMHPVYGYELARLVDGEYGDIGYCESCNSSIGHFHKSGCIGISTIVTEKMKKTIYYHIIIEENVENSNEIESVEDYLDNSLGEIKNMIKVLGYGVTVNIFKE